MPYNAQKQSLFGGVGAPNPPTTQIDVPGAIDALTSGATSLIHNAMLRRTAQNAQTLEQQRYASETANQQAELAFRQKEAADASAERAQRFQLDQEAERHRFIEAGGIPGSTDTQQVAGSSPITALNPVPTSPIQRAMTQGTGAAGTVPGVQVTPSAPPAAAGPSSVTSYHPETVTTPESYDPTRGAAYLRATAVAQARGEVQEQIAGKRNAAIQSARAYSAGAAQDLARLRASLANQKGAVAKAMTGNVREAAMQKTASGLIAQFDGSYDDAANFLNNTAEGKQLRDEGLEPRHLMYAKSQLDNGTTGQALRLESGADGLKPPAAVAAVTATKRLIGGNAPKPAGSASTADNFSDDEVADAMKAGKTTPADVRAYITQQRSKKKATP